MRATFVSKEKNDVKFTMEFESEEFEKAVNKAYQKSREKFRIDGFRKGKAPRGIIERHYGENIFFEDAINDLFSDSYPKAIDELKLEIIDQPRAEFGKVEKGKGFTVTITVAVYPEFEVKDYKGVKIEKVDAKVTDEDVEKELATLQKQNSRMVLAERPIQDGDLALIDFEGRIDDKQFEGGTGERHPLKIGSNTFIPGFEEQLIGAKAGEEKEVKVTFPKDYQAEDLAGKEAVFQCKVHEVKEEELPEIDDDFVKDVSEFDSLEEWKKDTRVRLEKEAAESADSKMKNAILEKIYNATDVEIPDIMIEDELDMKINDFDQQLKSQGMALDQYLKYLQKELKDLRKDMREQAVRSVKTKMIISAIADAEDFQVSEEDMDQYINDMAGKYQMEAEKIRETITGANKSYVEKDIKSKKAIEFLYDNATIK